MSFGLPSVALWRPSKPESLPQVESLRLFRRRELGAGFIQLDEDKPAPESFI